MKPKYRDTVKDYRPTIPLKSIKQKYTPTQSYVSQDNRSNWQHEQDAEMADRAYKQQMEDRKMQEGLHNLNGFLTFTDYAGLATGVGGLVSKGVKQLVKRGAKRAVKNRLAGSASSGKSVSVIGDTELSKMLPDYAKPNWQGDAVELTKQRLKDGGFDRLEEIEGGVRNRKLLEMQKKYGLDFSDSYNDFSPEGRARILAEQPRTGYAKDFGSVPNDLGKADRQNKFYTSLFKDAPSEYQNPQSISDITAHEFSHLAYVPDKLPSLNAYFPSKGTSTKVSEYLIGSGKLKGAELTARGTQVKNYFGLKEGKPITGDMLKYASKNYINDRGYDNVMGAFFDGIKDHKQMAEWLTKFSPIVATPVILNNKKK